MKLYTVHHHLDLHRYGFETSQQARMNLVKLNNIDYAQIITSVQFCKSIEKSFKSIGYIYGDLVYLPELFLGKQISYSESTKVEFSNGCYAKFYYYSDSSKPSNCFTDSWMYYKNGAWYSEEDLIIWYFSNLVDSLSDSVVIRDDFRIPMPKLVRFMQYRGISYYECIHMNVVGSSFISLINKKVTYLVASETLTKYLNDVGYSTLFLPPIYIEDIKSFNIPKVERYLYVGNMASYKNPKQLIDIANELSKIKSLQSIKIDIYGGTREDFKKLLPESCNIGNLSYKGVVNQVPYELYDGYISTSTQELFSNTCVEAMSYGLKCICSDILLPYKYYHDNTGGEVSICHTTRGFVNEIFKAYEGGFTSINQYKFLFRYSKEEVSNIFLKILKQNIKG